MKTTTGRFRSTTSNIKNIISAEAVIAEMKRWTNEDLQEHRDYSVNLIEHMTEWLRDCVVEPNDAG